MELEKKITRVTMGLYGTLISMIVERILLEEVGVVFRCCCCLSDKMSLNYFCGK